MNGKATIAKRREELSKIFRMAIAQERRAQAMYQRAMSFCDDADWKSLLSGLREDEARHEQELLALHKELSAFLERQAAAAPAKRKPKKAAARKATA
jgi:rubrerythrin